MVREDCVANREAKRSCTHKPGVRERFGLAARPEPFATRPEPGRALDCSVVAANLLAGEASGEKVAGRVFKIGGGASISILQLIEELNRLTGKTLPASIRTSARGRCAPLLRGHQRDPGRHWLSRNGGLARRITPEC